MKNSNFKNVIIYGMVSILLLVVSMFLTFGTSMLVIIFANLIAMLSLLEAGIKRKIHKIWMVLHVFSQLIWFTLNCYALLLVPPIIGILVNAAYPFITLGIAFTATITNWGRAGKS